MVSVYALLCAAALLRSECSTATAIDVLRMPAADNEFACLRDGMTTLAGLAIQPRADEYWKVVCGNGGGGPPNVAGSPQPDQSTMLHAPQLESQTRASTESADRD